jgi:uncharacterized protein YyaL (SSP411 family)
MEEESFEDVATARELNQDYIAIKVDRELRPDLDQIYQDAARQMGLGGGWPLNVWLTPDRHPFFAGTFFPAETGPRGRAFREVLAELARSYRDNPQAVEAQALQHWAELAVSAAPHGAGAPGAGAIRTAVAHLAQRFEPEWGGFSRGTKFPEPPVLELLLRYHRRTGDAQALSMLTVTLDAMLTGGIYDQLGGGFHRYATDPRWLVPHFEKMLYDTALLVPVYLGAYQVTGRADYARVARESLDWLVREMSDGAGFYGAMDADSPGGEGSYYVWTPGQVDAVLGPELGPLARAYFGVSEVGSFQGQASTLTRRRQVADVAVGRDAGAVAADLERARVKLLAARAERPRPEIDRKLIVAWNGLAISALANGAEVLGEPRYLAAAEKAADLMLGSAWQGGKLAHALIDRKPVGDGYLDDHAFLVAGLVDLFETDHDRSRLEAALRIEDALERAFSDARGGLRTTSAAHEHLLPAALPDYDGVLPAGSSVAARNLYRLALYTGDDARQRRADALVASRADVLARTPEAMPALLAALDFALDEAKQVVVLAPAGGNADLLTARVAHVYLPNRALVVAGETAAPELAKLTPLVADKHAEGGPTAYVCAATHCELPTDDPAVLEATLRKVAPLPP